MFTGSVAVTITLVCSDGRSVFTHLHIVQVVLVEYCKTLGHETVIICNFYRSLEEKEAACMLRMVK